MSGASRLLYLLLTAAASLLLLGCGVPIAPAEITATAVTEEQNAPQEDLRPLQAAFSGGGVDDSALTLRTAPGEDSPEPIPTIEQFTPTPETAAAAEATPTPQPSATATSPTPAATEATTPDAGDDEVDGEATASASGTPIEVATPTAPPEPTSTPQPVVSNVNGSFVTEFLALLNAQRTGRGMNALTLNATLSGGATKYAGYMGTAGFFGHYGPDGSSPESRVVATGYAGAYNGEALAAGQWTPQAALNALLASAPHAKILLDPSSVEVGVGYAFVEASRYRHYWVVVTGIP